MKKDFRNVKEKELTCKNKKQSKTVEINVGLTVLKIIAIILIVVLLASKTIITIIGTKTDVSEAETTEQATYYLVDSTELDDDGNYIQVPVPVGYTASEIEGETGVSTGFVIYEGDIDWSEIIVDTSTTSSKAKQRTTIIDDDDEEESENEVSDTSSEGDESEDGTNDTNTTDSNIDETEGNTSEENDNNDSTENQDTQSTSEESEENADEETDEEANTTVEEIQASVENSEASTSADYYLSDYYSEETASNIWDLQTSTNQYVWVPIDEEELENIYGVDENGKYWGKLYSNYSTALNWTETDGVMSITSTSSYREPTALTSLTAYDTDMMLTSYLNGTTRYELLTQELEENFYETIESIRKYGGFYIGRYETGDLSEDKASVTKANDDISNQTWYVMYEKCKELAGENTSVSTSMIWGSLWDATLRWLYDSGAKISDGTTLTTSMIWSSSSGWGNYEDATFDYYTSYNSTPTEPSSEYTKLGAGVAEYTKVNNIYDIAGNVKDCTLEIGYEMYVTARGGAFHLTGDIAPAGERYTDTRTENFEDIGCRSSLFIK